MCIRDRCVDLAGVTRRIAQLFEHRLIQKAQRVNLVARVEVYIVDLVQYVTEKISVDHAVDRASKDRSDDITPISYTHLRAHETRHDLVCRLLLEKKKKKKN